MKTCQVKVLTWANERCEALVPRPVRTIYEELYKLEKNVLRASPGYSDVIVTVFLILACIILILCLILYVSFQLYTESVVMVKLSSTVMSNLANSTFYQQINETIVGKCVESGVDVCSSAFPGMSLVTLLAKIFIPLDPFIKHFTIL